MKTKTKQIKQRLVATVIILFMFVMVFGSMNISDVSAIGTNTTLIQNLVAGTLQLEAPATLPFNNLTVAVAANSLANLDVVNMRDYRGSGAGWSVTGTMNNLYIVTAGVNNISNAVIAWAPGSQFALDSASNTGVAIGAAGYFSAARTLINASAANGLGNYRVNGTTVNVVYSGSPTQLAGTYQNTLLMTIQ